MEYEEVICEDRLTVERRVVSGEVLWISHPPQLGSSPCGVEGLRRLTIPPRLCDFTAARAVFPHARRDTVLFFELGTQKKTRHSFGIAVSTAALSDARLKQ